LIFLCFILLDIFVHTKSGASGLRIKTLANPLDMIDQIRLFDSMKYGKVNGVRQH
jgi:hypothetical protein